MHQQAEVGVEHSPPAAVPYVDAGGGAGVQDAAAAAALCSSAGRLAAGKPGPGSGLGPGGSSD